MNKRQQLENEDVKRILWEYEQELDNFVGSFEENNKHVSIMDNPLFLDAIITIMYSIRDSNHPNIAQKINIIFTFLFELTSIETMESCKTKEFVRSQLKQASTHLIDRLNVQVLPSPSPCETLSLTWWQKFQKLQWFTKYKK